MTEFLIYSKQTFIENAFKHGVANELDQAKINIAITKHKGNLEFLIENSKPTATTNTSDK